MRNQLLITVMLLLSPVLMSNACRKAATTKKDPCSGVMCTEVFAMVTTEVIDRAGVPLQFDEVYTVRLKTNTRLKAEQNIGEGRYTVVDDSHQKALANTKESFRFVGIKNGKKLVDEPFTIVTDCCHVSKESGADIITVP